MNRKLTSLVLASGIAAISACSSDDNSVVISRSGNPIGQIDTTSGDGIDGSGGENTTEQTDKTDDGSSSDNPTAQTDNTGGDDDGSGSDDPTGQTDNTGDGIDDSGSDNTAPQPNETDGSPTQGVETTAGTYNVSFTNLSIGQPISPPVAVIHNPDFNFLRIGTVSSPELQAIAEDGNNEPMLALANSLEQVTAVGVAFVDAANPEPIPPGETATITLETDGIGQVFTAIAMITCTNDAYTGANSRALPNGNDTLIIESIPYDAGTEVNTLDADYWVAPCGGSGNNLHEDEGGVASVHPGQPGVGNFDFFGMRPIIRIEVRRQQ